MLSSGYVYGAQLKVLTWEGNLRRESKQQLLRIWIGVVAIILYIRIVTNQNEECQAVHENKYQFHDQQKLEQCPIHVALLSHK